MRGLLKAIIRWWLARGIPDNFRGGDICVVVSEGGDYKVAKVLRADESTVHIRLYRHRFLKPPAEVETALLSLGTMNDAEGFGIGHLPLSRSTLASWTPVRIQHESVTDEELEGYRMWEEEEGGTWG